MNHEKSYSVAILAFVDVISRQTSHKILNRQSGQFIDSLHSYLIYIGKLKQHFLKLKVTLAV